MEGLILNRKEQKRLQVLNMVLEDMCSVAEAGEVIGLSERQVWRLLSTYRKEGAKALVHGNRGHQPANTLPLWKRERIVELAQGKYCGVNHCHLTELLAEREGLQTSRSTLRRILICASIGSPRQRRQAKHRCRRERYPQEGMLLQIDGSRHDWLESRGPYLTLIGAIDDATGTVPYALFREQEDAQGYFMLLSEVVKSKGMPLAVYSDRHAIFQRTKKEGESLTEQLEGKRQPTQFGRALEELDIQPIFALSPQAKGRIERLWGTLQDRLVSELRLAGASTIEEANRVLCNFLPRFNAQFSVSPSQSGSAYRHLPTGLCLESVLCFKYQRTVASDNTVSFNRQTLQLMPGWDRLSYSRAKVEIQERLDGSLVVFYHDKVVATRPAPSHPATLRARKSARCPASVPEVIVVKENSGTGCGCQPQQAPMNRGQSKALGPVFPPHKPASDHPWRKKLLTKSLNN